MLYRNLKSAGWAIAILLTVFCSIAMAAESILEIKSNVVQCEKQQINGIACIVCNPEPLDYDNSPIPPCKSIKPPEGMV